MTWLQAFWWAVKLVGGCLGVALGLLALAIGPVLWFAHVWGVAGGIAGALLSLVVVCTVLRKADYERWL